MSFVTQKPIPLDEANHNAQQTQAAGFPLESQHWGKSIYEFYVSHKLSTERLVKNDPRLLAGIIVVSVLALLGLFYLIFTTNYITPKKRRRIQ
jgi:hypothetical protein